MANGKDSGYKIQFHLLQVSWIYSGKAGGVEFYWQETATGTYRSYIARKRLPNNLGSILKDSNY